MTDTKIMKSIQEVLRWANSTKYELVDGLIQVFHYGEQMYYLFSVTGKMTNGVFEVKLTSLHSLKIIGD